MENLRKAFYLTTGKLPFSYKTYEYEARRCVKCGHIDHKGSWWVEYNSRIDVVDVVCPKCGHSVSFLPLDREE